MKKTLIALLCVILVISIALAACGGKDSADTGNTTAAKPEETTAPTQMPTVTEEPEQNTEETAEETTMETTEAATEETTEPTTQAPTEEIPEETYHTPVPQPTDPPAGGADVPAPPPTNGDYSALADFLSDAAFIGDSVTLKLRNYHMATGYMGGVTFLCQGSYSVAHAVNNSMYLSYQGQDMTPQDALTACGAKKVFIQLGMNDIALWGIDSTMESWAKLIGNIRAKNPDIAIYIQSGTPIYTAGQIGDLNNKNMDAYNARLEEFANANGCHFINLAPYFKDSSNGLAEAYCSDAYVHFTDTACKLWLDLIKDYLGI